MLNKKLKLLIAIFLVLSLVFSFSSSIVNATNEAVVTSEISEEEAVSTEEPEYEEHSGDLYLFENEINMDKLVDGNVFIVGKNVTITGQVNGNLFIFADSVKFEGSYVVASTFVCANDVFYNGYSNDLYVAADKLEMTFNSYVIRDVKATTSEAIIKAAIGRDLDLLTDSIDFGATAIKTENTNTENTDSESAEIDDEVPVIYGNLRYSAKNELNLVDGIVEGDVTYNKDNNLSSDITNIILELLISIITAIVVFLLFTKFAPKCINKIQKQSATNLVLSLVVGTLATSLIAIISIVFISIRVGAILGAALLFILLTLILIASSVVSILIAKKIYSLLKLNNKILEYIFVAVVAVILYALGLIPYAGLVITAIIKLFGIGLILVSTFSKEKSIKE